MHGCGRHLHLHVEWAGLGWAGQQGLDRPLMPKEHIFLNTAMQKHACRCKQMSIYILHTVEEKSQPMQAGGPADRSRSTGSEVNGF